MLVAVLTSMADAAVIVPETVRDAKPLDAFSIFTVFVAPDSVTVLVPLANVEPAPLVSQLPETVHDPDVRVIVPLAPPVIVTLATVTVAALPFTTPPLLTVRLPVPKDRNPAPLTVRVPVTETLPLPLLIVPVETLKAVPVPIVIDATVIVEVLPVIPPVPTRETAAPPEMLLPEVVSVPAPDVAKVLDSSIALDRVTVPETVRL